MRVDACVLVLKSMILLASKLPQNPIFITILSDNPHLKNKKTERILNGHTTLVLCGLCLSQKLRSVLAGSRGLSAIG